MPRGLAQASAPRWATGHLPGNPIWGDACLGLTQNTRQYHGKQEASQECTKLDKYLYILVRRMKLHIIILIWKYYKILLYIQYLIIIISHLCVLFFLPFFMTGYCRDSGIPSFLQSCHGSHPPKRYSHSSWPRQMKQNPPSNSQVTPKFGEKNRSQPSSCILWDLVWLTISKHGYVQKVYIWNPWSKTKDIQPEPRYAMKANFCDNFLARGHSDHIAQDYPENALQRQEHLDS